MTNRFFENLRDYSEIKLRILERFLPPWAAKLGYGARARGGRRIWYVDGFAGRGRYDDGRPGSPLLGLNHAATIQQENRGYELGCFLIEKNRNHYRALGEEAESFRRQGLIVRNERGVFADLISSVVEETAGCPVLLFVDPFGISPLKYDSFRQLLRRQPPLDLILTFQHRAVHRLAAVRPNLITEAIGTDEWLEPWGAARSPTQRVDQVLGLFRRNILQDGRFIGVFSYPIRASIQASPRYYLVFASRAPDAFELWNDQVAEAETTLSLQATRSTAQASFLPVFDEEVYAVHLLNEIRAFMLQHETTTRRSIVMHFVRIWWGRYQTKDIKRAVRELIASGEILRAGESGIDTDILRLRRPNQTVPQG